MTQADLDAMKEKVGTSESRFTLNERSLKKQIAVMKAEIDDHEQVRVQQITNGSKRQHNSIVDRRWH